MSVHLFVCMIIFLFVCVCVYVCMYVCNVCGLFDVCNVCSVCNVVYLIGAFKDILPYSKCKQRKIHRQFPECIGHLLQLDTASTWLVACPMDMYNALLQYKCNGDKGPGFESWLRH